MKLKGGLGNQMFQYALGRKLSLLNDDILKLDNNEYKKAYCLGKRKYELNNFNIKADIANSKEILKIRGFSNRILLKLNLVKNNYIREKNTNIFDPEILNKKGDLYLDGYWQSENYFKDIRKIILNDFTLNHSIKNEKFYNVLDEIKKNNSVAIHIRGGDYVHNEDTRKFHGLLTADYYNQAIDCISKSVHSPKFYIFTDDLQHSQKLLENLDNLKYTLISINKFFDYEELMLMKNCKYFIIPNSSFSWWGAWLSEFKDKIVIVPKYWFKNEKRKDVNIAADGWIKINNICL